MGGLVKMKLSDEDKLEIAQKLRNTTVVQLTLTPEYEKNLELTICEEKSIPTREGSAHVYLITPKRAQKKSKPNYPLFINMHGGGFVRGYGKRDTIFCSLIASRVGCKVIDIDYKLAPEYPFPAAIKECYDVVKWAYEHAEDLHIDKENIAVGGHSAGGNFTAAIALMANQRKDFTIKLQIMDYAFLDAATDPADKVTENDILPVERMRQFNQLYLENEKDAFNPLASPVLAPKEMLPELPPALVITAGKDCFHVEAEKYAMMMVEAGVEVKIKRFLNSQHGFTINCNQEFEEANKLIINTLRQKFYECK
jgi:acetyl esterase